MRAFCVYTFATGVTIGSIIYGVLDKNVPVIISSCTYGISLTLLMYDRIMILRCHNEEPVDIEYYQHPSPSTYPSEPRPPPMSPEYRP